MSVYAATLSSPGIAALGAIADVETISGSTSILEVCVCGTGVGITPAIPIALGIPTNVPSALYKIPFISEALDANPPSGAGIGMVWGVAPAAPTSFYRRAFLKSLGAFLIWTFPRGILIPAAASCALWQTSTNGAAATPLSTWWEIAE